MSAGAIPSCAAGITAEQLSAWRDERLGASDAHRLEAHTATCSACRERLEEYASIAAALHEQSVPVPDERLWHGVRARIAMRRQRVRQVYRSGQLWKSLVAVAAAVLLVAGFAQLLGGYLGGSTTAVAWRQVTLPPGVSLSDSHTLSVSAHDGSTAYICAAPFDLAGTPIPISTVTPIVWVTRDRGVHWSRTAALPTTRRDINICDVTVDDVNPAIALAFVSTVANANEALAPSPASTESYATFDGGNTWTRLVDPQTFSTLQLATVGGTTYARRAVQVPAANPSETVGAYRLFASDDRMRTWRPVDDQIVSSGQYISRMWVDPNTGDMLAQAGAIQAPQQDQEPPQQLWRSGDGGRTWSPLTSPTSGDFVVRVPIGGQSWYICQGSYDSANSQSSVGVSGGRPSSLRCSEDGGRTWVSRPVYSQPVTGAQPAHKSITISWPATVFAITRDGALLAMGNGPYEPKLYRLPAESGRWESLGDVPLRAGVLVEYFLAPGAGTLWNGPVAGSYLGPSGALAVYVAPYPAVTSAQPTSTGSVTQVNVSWHSAPQQVSALGGGAPLAYGIAPADGNTVYACTATTEASGVRFNVWLTRDGAAHWTQTAQIPLVQGAGAGQQCSLAVDTTDARIAIVGVGLRPPGHNPGPASNSTYVTRDEGASWQRLVNPPAREISQVATYGQVTYAVSASYAAPPSLMASSDGMRTWHGVDANITAQGAYVSQFWLDPATGAVLAVALSQSSPQTLGPVWITHDGGQHWTALPSPDLTQFVVLQPSADRPWQICGVTLGTSLGSTVRANQLYCSADGGATWEQRPVLNVTYTCLKCSGQPGTPTTLTYPMILVGITSDDTLLAAVEVPAGTALVPEPPNTPLPEIGLYRLPAGATSWQAIGTLPAAAGPDVQYIPAPGHGVLWAIGDYLQLYTAAYP